MYVHMGISVCDSAKELNNNLVHDQSDKNRNKIKKKKKQ